MQVMSECNVDFVWLPLDLPIIENCRKCLFFGTRVTANRCIRADRRICDNGRAGYFVKSYLREAPDIINNAWIEEDELISGTIEKYIDEDEMEKQKERMAKERGQLVDAEEFVDHSERWRRKEKPRNYFGGEYAGS
jgi:hypothetical protein